MSTHTKPGEIANPVIPGFYSDPSICRVGKDYYTVCSSFEFYPGVPLFHSRDLVNWEQISYCLSRSSQLPLANAVTSDGIYAPTLRYHDQLFYMITSNRCSSFGNHFYVTASAPEGPFSEPVWIVDVNGDAIDGVDPSLYFDDDGSVYFSCVAWDADGQGIGQAPIDLSLGRLLEPLKVIWHGTGGTFPEGPHTYRQNGWYYLMIAEGGTEYGHKVSIARSLNIQGPYESCPFNPVLTQNYQSVQSGCIQGVGHGDLLEAHDKTWWMIVHGFRTSVGKLHHLGRETMLVPVQWDENGWPVMNGDGRIGETTLLPGDFARTIQKEIPGFTEDFSSPTPDLCWNFLRNPHWENYQFSALDGKGVILLGSPASLNQENSPSWMGVRQRHFNCQIQIDMRFTPNTSDEAGFSVFQTPEHHYDIVITSEEGKTVCFLRKIVGDIEWTGAKFPLSCEYFSLRITASRTDYHFYLSEGNNDYELGRGRTQLLSTEAMQYQNFTGTFFALFAVSKNAHPAPALFQQFLYEV